jgi:hypothetical protein
VLAFLSTMGAILLLGVCVAALVLPQTNGVDAVAFELLVGGLVLILMVLGPAAWFVSALNRRFNPSRRATIATIASASACVVWFAVWAWIAR